MQLTGIIIAVLETKSGVSQSGRSWARQEFVLQTEEQYPKKCCFTLFGEERINNAALAQNMRVAVDFDIDAREHNGRWYNDVQAWKVTNLDAQPQQSPQQATQPQGYTPQSGIAANPTSGSSPNPTAQPHSSQSDEDNLPF